MAIVANTYTTYDTAGIREQLDDAIYNIAPTDTPFLSGIAKGKAQNVNFEWQVDTLAANANNAQLDGDDVASFTAVAAPVRTSNRTQISRKVFLVSATEQAILKAGRKDEVAYLTALKVKELKRDQETALTQNTTAVVGTTTVARQTCGLEGWVGTNNSLGATGVAPVHPTSAAPTGTAPTDGTQRAFTETLLRTVLLAQYTAGGNPDTLLVGPGQRQVVSTFTGNATRYKKAEDSVLNSTITLYISDFGELKVVPDRFQRNRTAFTLQMDMWELMVLRSYDTVELAKTGDADKRMIVVEYGLKSKQEAASGAVRDLT